MDRVGLAHRISPRQDRVCASCQTSYTPTSQAQHTITAAYPRSGPHHASAGRITITATYQSLTAT
jgi:hypothetical protein